MKIPETLAALVLSLLLPLSLIAGERIRERVVVTEYPLLPYYVSCCDLIADFGAGADGTTDDTGPLRRAIGYVASLGGGTVTVPAGNYLITGDIEIPASVYLVGQWYDPDTRPEMMREGTVLHIKLPPGITEPLFKIGAGAGMIGFTVYYHGQDPDDPVPYPTTFSARDAKLNRYASGFSTMRYITVVNPYRGFDLGPHPNECHLLDHIYMSPLETGVFIEGVSDIGRINHLNIGARYWADFDPDVDFTAVERRMKGHTTGLAMHRTDWQHNTHFNIRDVRYGIVNKKYTYGNEPVNSCNSCNADITMSNVRVGFYFEYADNQGTKLHQVDITADGSPGSACILVSGEFEGGTTIYGGKLSNPGGECITIADAACGALSVNNIEFTGYGATAIRAGGSTVSVINCRFDSPEGCALWAGINCGGITAGKNLYGSDGIRYPSSLTNVWIDDDSLYTDDNGWMLPSDEIIFHPPGSYDMVSVTDFGARGCLSAPGKIEPGSDATEAFRHALERMGSAGGGIVYVPAGVYYLGGPLTVPPGVELRGVSNAMHHTSAMGTVLLTTHGRDDPDGEAFLNLMPGSAVAGLTVWYPENNALDPTPYSYTVRGLGENIRVVNFTVGNGYNGIDLSRYDCAGHQLHSVAGLLARNIVSLDRCSGPGHIMASHFNVHFAARTQTTGLPGSADFIDFRSGFQTLFGVQNRLCDALVLGRAEDEMIWDLFVYRSRNGVRLVPGARGGSFRGTITYGGFDAVMDHTVDSRIDTDTDINFYLWEGDAWGYGLVENRGTGALNFYSPNFNSWNTVPDRPFTCRSGSVNIHCGFFRVSSPDGTLTALPGAKLSAEGSIFMHVGTILPENKGFNIQKKEEVIDFRGDGTSIDARYNIGINHFGNEEVPRSNIFK